MSAKDMKNSARYQSPISQHKSGDRKVEEFTSPITQWLSSPFCQLDILSPNDGSLAFSISSPVQLSPYLPTTSHVMTKSPGTFSPSIFSSYQESAYFDEHDGIGHRSDRKPVFDEFESEMEEASSKKGIFSDSGSIGPFSKQSGGGSVGISSALKKSSLYGRLEKRPDKMTSSDDGLIDTVPSEINHELDSFSSSVLRGVPTLGRGGVSGNEVGDVDGERVLEAPNEASSPDLSSVGRSHRSNHKASIQGGGRARGSTSTTTTMESMGSDALNMSDSFSAGGSTNVGHPAVAPTGNSTTTDDTTKCNCKKSKCLKLYCECFVGMKYCGDTCRCRDCYNNLDHDSERQEAIRLTKTRNGTAFQAKVSAALKVHLNGCNCKQSQCLKKYCECFTGGALCGSNCKCLSCQNYSGSESLISAKHQLHEPVPTQASGAGMLRVGGQGGGLVAQKYGDLPRTRYNSVSASADAQVSSSGFLTGFGDYDQSVDIFDDAFVAMAEVAGQSKAVASDGVAIGMDYVAANRKRSAPENGSADDGFGTGRANSRSTRSSSKSSSSAVAPTEYVSYPGSSIVSTRMNTRALVRHGSIPPRGNGEQFVEDGGDQKSKARRIANGTSPSGVTDLPFVISPLGMQVDVSVVGAGYLPLSQQQQLEHMQLQQQKKKGVAAYTTTIVYPFFGEQLPPTPKIIALRCLEFLDGPSLYNMSLVNTLWCKAAMDDALWE